MTSTDEPPTLAPVPRIPLSRLAILRATRDFHTAAEAFRDAGGPVTRSSLGPRWLVPEITWVASPQGAHDVLTAPRGVVDKKTAVYTELHHLVGGNLFDLADTPWLPRRRTVQPVFTKQHVRSYGGEMSSAAEAVAARWPESDVVDLDREARHITIDALCHSVLGYETRGHDDLGHHVRTLLQHAADRSMRPVNPPHWLPTPAHRKAYAAAAKVREVAADVVERCRENPATDAPLVHALLAARDPETGEALTREQITDELVVFLMAGHDTTATTLAYTMWQLGRNPEMQERVRREARDRGPGMIGPDDVGELRYTMQVLHESLRMCPPGAMISRYAVEDFPVDGHLVPAGDLVVVSVYALHRDPSLWEDALTFDPERFRPERMKSIDRWQYMPFGGGRRSCVGDHFAMLEATLALATVIRDVEVDSLEAEFPMSVPFTLVAAEPIPARVRREA